jgi:hypothetical protein
VRSLVPPAQRSDPNSRSDARSKRLRARRAQLETSDAPAANLEGHDTLGHNYTRSFGLAPLRPRQLASALG